MALFETDQLLAPVAYNQKLPNRLYAQGGEGDTTDPSQVEPFDVFVQRLFMPDEPCAHPLTQAEAYHPTVLSETTLDIDLSTTEINAIANNPGGLMAKVLAKRHGVDIEALVGHANVVTQREREYDALPLAALAEPSVSHRTKVATTKPTQREPDFISTTAVYIPEPVETTTTNKTDVRAAFKQRNIRLHELAQAKAKPTQRELAEEHYTLEILRARSENRVPEIGGSPVDHVVREIHRRLQLGYDNRNLGEFTGFLNLVNENIHTLTQLQQAQTSRLIDYFSKLMDEALYQPTLYDNVSTQAKHAYGIAKNATSSVVSATQNVAILARNRLHDQLGIIPLEEAVGMDSELDAVDIITQQYESNISTDVPEVATEYQPNRVVLAIQNQLVQYLGSDDRIAFNNTVFDILEDLDDYTTIELQHIQSILENIAQLFDEAYEEWHPASLYQWANEKALTMIGNLPVLYSTIIENTVDYSLLNTLNKQVQYRQFGTADLRIEPAITTRAGQLEPGFLRRNHPDNTSITNLPHLFSEPFVALPTPNIEKDIDPIQAEIDEESSIDAQMIADELTNEIKTVIIKPETNVTHLVNTGTNLIYLFEKNNIQFVDPYIDCPTELARAEVTAGAMYQEMFTTLLEEPEALDSANNRRRTAEFFQALLSEYHFRPSNDYAVALLINTMRSDVSHVREILVNHSHLELDDILDFTTMTLRTVVAELKAREVNNTLQLNSGGMLETMQLLIVELSKKKKQMKVY